MYRRRVCSHWVHRETLRGAGIESPEVLRLRAQTATLGLSSVLGSQTQLLVHTKLSLSLTLHLLSQGLAV